MNEISICNAALGYLGEAGNVVTINPPDGSPYSETCSVYFPIALRYLLEQHNWSFAMQRMRLAKLPNFDKELYGWQFGYNLPYNFVRIIGVFTSQTLDEKSADYEIEGFQTDSRNNAPFILLTNVENPILRFISNQQTNISLLPNYFCQALIVQLASYLAGPLMKTTLADRLNQLAAQALEHAKYLDSRNTIRKTHDYLAEHLRARSN